MFYTGGWRVERQIKQVHIALPAIYSPTVLPRIRVSTCSSESLHGRAELHGNMMMACGDVEESAQLRNKVAHGLRTRTP